MLIESFDLYLFIFASKLLDVPFQVHAHCTLHTAHFHTTKLQKMRTHWQLYWAQKFYGWDPFVRTKQEVNVNGKISVMWIFAINLSDFAQANNQFTCSQMGRKRTYLFIAHMEIPIRRAIKIPRTFLETDPRNECHCTVDSITLYNKMVLASEMARYRNSISVVRVSLFCVYRENKYFSLDHIVSICRRLNNVYTST